MRLRTLVIIAILISAPTFAPDTAARAGAPPVPLAIDGFPLAVSPDGASIAGVDRTGQQFCVWEIATREATCDGDLPAPVEARSVTWAPDSAAVAFSLGSSSRFVDSDIYLFEVPDGSLRDLTDDDMNGTDGDPISIVLRSHEPFPVDVFPAWSPDSASLLFARSTWEDEDAQTVTLMTIPRHGGAPQPFAALDDVALFGVAGPMIWREDGSVLLTTRHPNPTDTSTAIRLLDADGTLTVLVDGSAAGPIADPVLASVSNDGTAVSAWSRLDFHEGLWAEGTPVFFHVAIGSGTATPWNEYPGVDLPDDARLLAPPVFGPDGSVAFLWRVRGGEMGISVLDGAGTFRTVSPVVYTPGGPAARNINALSPTLQWADDGTLLLVLATGGAIIALEAAGATPVATPGG